MADEFATVDEHVKVLEAQFGGAFEREPLADGTVVVRLRSQNGDALAGTGATTAEAVRHLGKRVAAFTAAMQQDGV